MKKTLATLISIMAFTSISWASEMMSITRPTMSHEKTQNNNSLVCKNMIETQKKMMKTHIATKNDKAHMCTEMSEYEKNAFTNDNVNKVKISIINK